MIIYTKENIPVVVFYFIALGALLILGINFGLKSPVWIDEIFSFYHSTGGILSDFISQTESGLNRMPPFYFLLTKLLFSEQSYVLNARVLSILFSSVTFLYLFKICNIWTDWSISFFLSALTLFNSTLFLQYSFEARPYSMCLMLLTLFCFYIIKYELTQKHDCRDYVILGCLCFLLPTSHYMYGISSFALGMTHIFFTRKDKIQVIITYVIAGLCFTALHLNIFLNQQEFGNLLAMIAYPTKEKIIGYLLSFFPVETMFILLTSILIFCTFKDNHYFLKKTNNFNACGYIGLSLICIIFLGIIFARNFHGDIWFLPRYYLGGILLVAFFAIPVFSTLKFKSRKTKVLLTTITLVLISANLYGFKKNHTFLHDNPQTFCYAYYPDKDLDSYDMPIVTDDPILFFHYLYEGVNLYFLTNDKSTKNNFQQFVPIFQQLMINEAQFKSMIFLTVKNKNQFLNSKFHNNTKLKFTVSPIHSAFLVQKL